MNISDLVIRPATLADYEAVINIDRDVYGGFDYLPAMYHEFLHNCHNLAVVAEYHGKVVAFSLHVWLAPGLLSGIAGRVHKDYRDVGISKVIYVKHVELSLKKHGCPLVIYAEFADNEMRKRFTARNQHFKLLREWQVLVFVGNNATVTTKSHMFKLSTPVRETMKETHWVSLQDVMSSNMLAAIKSLLNRDHESFGYLKYTNFPVEDNFIRDAALRSDVLVTQRKGSDGMTEQNGVIAVSFTCLSTCALGILVHIWFYIKGPDVSVVLTHVHMALDKLAHVIGNNDVAITLHFSNTLPAVDIENGLKERLGGGVPQPDMPTNRMFGGKYVYTAKL